MPRVLDGCSRIRVRLFGTLASVAFALAVIGIYGLELRLPTVGR
jgi:hypothetical protein